MTVRAVLNATRGSVATTSLCMSPYISYSLTGLTTLFFQLARANRGALAACLGTIGRPGSFESLSAPQLFFVQMLRIKLNFSELKCEQCLLSHRN